MPTPLHEAIITLLRARPACIVRLIAAAPAALRVAALARDEVRLEGRVTAVRVDDTTVSQLPLIRPARSNDMALALTLAGRPPRQGFVIVEVQLRVDSRKEVTWPFTWSATHARIDGGPVWVIVITPNRATERWAIDLLGRAIPALGHFVVLGPTTLERVRRGREARRDPERALLSGLVHAGKRGDHELVPAIVAACSTLRGVDGMLHVHDVIASRLTPSGKAALMSLTQKTKPYVWQSDFAKHHQAVGLERGRAEHARAAILTILEERDIPVTRQQTALVKKCADLAQLDRWLRRAVTARSATTVFRNADHRKARVVRSARRATTTTRRTK